MNFSYYCTTFIKIVFQPYLHQFMTESPGSFCITKCIISSTLLRIRYLLLFLLANTSSYQYYPEQLSSLCPECTGTPRYTLECSGTYQSGMYYSLPEVSRVFLTLSGHPSYRIVHVYKGRLPRRSSPVFGLLYNTPRGRYPAIFPKNSLRDLSTRKY